MFPQPHKLKEMVLYAMKENAPGMYSRLRKQGKLGQFAQMRASQATKQFNEQMSLMSPADTKQVVSAQNEGYSQTVQAWSRREKRIEESVLAQALEFPMEEQEATT